MPVSVSATQVGVFNLFNWINYNREYLSHDLVQFKTYWMYVVGIFMITVSAFSFFDFEGIFYTAGITILTGIVFRFFDLNTLPNVFTVYLMCFLIRFAFLIHSYSKFMDHEVLKLSKHIEIFGRETILLDIQNISDKIDAEYLFNYYKIGNIKNKAEIADQINKLLVPENIKLCDRDEILRRLEKVVNLIKANNINTPNSIYIRGFKPSNSLIRFYLKLLSIKRAIVYKNEIPEKFNSQIVSVLNKLNNKFDPKELINLSSYNTIPDYKLRDENYVALINRTINSIERYIDIYNQNNFGFM